MRMSCSIMKIPCGFKIRKKTDCDVFINDCMCKDSQYSVIDKGTQVVIDIDKEGKVSIATRDGDLRDIFNPLLEVARTKNNCYKATVQDYIWKYRKVINDKWFNERKEW